MLSFTCDYSEGAHGEILKRLAETNLEQLPGYGEDRYCKQAREKIQTACGCPDAEVFFLVGGTQTNETVIGTLLKSYEGVVSAPTGHINCHEAGAVEYTGHKVLVLPEGKDRKDSWGKIQAEELQTYLENFFSDENHEHMVFPGMVYISHPTEYGTLYSREELQAISQICRAYQIPLFLDGARLGYGLMGEGTDVTLPDIARFCDVFYIGGTKVGALCGEAVVFSQMRAPAHFMTMVKQHGAMLAKGRLLGIQFDTLFTNDLYLKISRHAIEMAALLKEVFHRKGYGFFLDSPTNQIFIILENQQMDQLAKEVLFGFWERLDETHTVVRFATSWATKQEDIVKLEELL